MGMYLVHDATEATMAHILNFCTQPDSRGRNRRSCSRSPPPPRNLHAGAEGDEHGHEAQLAIGRVCHVGMRVPSPPRVRTVRDRMLRLFRRGSRRGPILHAGKGTVRVVEVGRECVQGKEIPGACGPFYRFQCLPRT